MWKKSALAFCVVGLAGMVGWSSLAQEIIPITVSLQTQAINHGGKFVLSYKPNRSTIYPDIAALALRSDIIIVGKTIGHKPSLRPDQKFITEDYFVKVQEVIKGTLPNNRSILVSLPGGAYKFSDGTVATVLPIDEKHAGDGQFFVFFLKSRLPVSVFNGYLLASETQGLFALTNGVVDPADAVVDDPVVVKYRGMTVPDFLREIHSAVAPTHGGGPIL